jgi:hypothetical protein
MKWWKTALIISGVWAVLTIGAGIIHTNVILAGKITPQQDEKISEGYGKVCGGGLVAAWVLSYLFRKRSAAAQ